jgi:hypothetical protein
MTAETWRVMLYALFMMRDCEFEGFLIVFIAGTL